MRILLSYSRELFNPALPEGEGLRWGSSANIIARTLHRILGELGDVTYVDAASPDEVGDEPYDLMVGIARNFGEVLARCRAPRSVLVAVNVHPAAHNEVLLDFVTREGLPSASLHELDVLDVPTAEAAIASADAILLFGNVAVWNTYVARGVPPQKIRVLNYGSDLRPPSEGNGRPPGVDILYAVSELGLRKGFDIVAATFRDLDLKGLDMRLHIVGTPSYRHYRDRLEALKHDLGDRIVDYGWLPSASGAYRATVAACDAMFFPSLEEGQAGTILDAMACGCVPIPSAASGVDFAPLGFAETRLDSRPNVALLEGLPRLTDGDWARLRAQTLEAYTELHAGFEEPLAAAVRGAVEGSLWPRASVVLPVHDKEQILPRVLELLDRALGRYGNSDLQIILDGCSDGSERIARDFVTARTSDYDVAIDVTPDIFEVKTNNLGLRRARGVYGVIVQDDNFIFDSEFLFEAVTFLEKNRRAAVLGGLAGVNYYPLGTTGLEGPGQIVMTPEEVYWRQDAATDAGLRGRIFRVDACMRGPLIVRKSFLEAHGYLDEAFAPLYCDDMDLCFRAADHGFVVYAALMDVENDSLTMGSYDADTAARIGPVMRRNLEFFYERWTPSVAKDYIWFHRVQPVRDGQPGERARRMRHKLRRRVLLVRRRWLNRTYALGIAVRVARRLGLRPR